MPEDLSTLSIGSAVDGIAGLAQRGRKPPSEFRLVFHHQNAQMFSCFPSPCKLNQAEPRLNETFRAIQAWSLSFKHMIKLQGLSKTYSTPAGDFTALRNIDLQIGDGEFVAIIGKSGSGKSTLLNLMGGIDSPTSGVVEIGGTALPRLSQSCWLPGAATMWGLCSSFFN